MADFNDFAEIERLKSEKDRIVGLLGNSSDINEQAKLQSELAIVSSNILCAHLDKFSGLAATVTQQGKDISGLRANVRINTHDIAELQDDFKAKNLDVKLLTGRIAQLENRLEEAHDAIHDLTARSMRMNLVVKTKGVLYQEQRGESYQTTTLLFRNFLRDEMGVPDVAKIIITRAHRMGFAAEGYNRPMIAQFLRQEDIDRVMSKAGMLKDKPHSVNIQIPNEYNERRQHAWGSFKTARNNGKEARLRPNGDLYVDKRLMRSLQPMKLPTSASANLSEIANNYTYGQSASHGNEVHTFLARAVTINSLQGVRDTMDIFCAETNIMLNANSISYAYRFRPESGPVIENFNSRGDTGVGPQILRQLRDKQAENVVCFTAHKYKDRSADPKMKTRLVETSVQEAMDTLSVAHSSMQAEEGED